MGLAKRTTTLVSEQAPAPRTLDELLFDLTDPSPRRRRAAARELAPYPQAIRPLCERLPLEPELGVRDSILSSLRSMPSEAVVAGLLPHLESDDVWLRNAVVEVLPHMLDAARPALLRRLSHPDPQVRILAATALAQLRDHAAAAHLCEVLAEESDPNVCAVVIEAVGEQGTGAAIPVLQGLSDRFYDEPFLSFAIDMAIFRIRARQT